MPLTISSAMRTTAIVAISAFRDHFTLRRNESDVSAKAQQRVHENHQGHYCESNHYRAISGVARA